MEKILNRMCVSAPLSSNVTEDERTSAGEEEEEEEEESLFKANAVNQEDPERGGGRRWRIY